MEGYGALDTGPGRVGSERGTEGTKLKEVLALRVGP